MTELSAVIFDMDGVLIDTEPVWRDVEIGVFERLGAHVTQADGIHTMGLRIHEVVDYHYARQPWASFDREQTANDILDGVIDHVANEGAAMPGAIAAMHAARDLHLPIAVASSSAHKLISAVLKRLEIADIVDAIASADDEDNGKPDPAVYLTAARALGVDPKSCLAVEDSPNGVTSARAAGMKCLAVPDPHAASDPRVVVADYQLPSLEEFPQWLELRLASKLGEEVRK